MSKRDDILDAIATALATITTANGYNTTVAAVYRVITDFDEAPPGKLPCVSFGPDGDTAEIYDLTPSNRIETTLRLRVAFHVAARNGAPKHEAVSALRVDILNCVNSNHRWGDLAIQTYPVNMESDEGLSHISDKVGTGHLLFHVEFHEYLNRPS